VRRAASSIPATIAEGYGCAGRNEYVQFLYVAQGSLKELETHRLLAGRVGCCKDADVDPHLRPWLRSRASAAGLSAPDLRSVVATRLAELAT
jgi:hypothetical protein